MSSKKWHNVKKILERLKQVLNIPTDSLLADYLGVRPNTISTWKIRNTIDYELLFSKCEDININWLLTGEGEPFLENKVISETKREYGEYDEITARIIKLLEDMNEEQKREILKHVEKEKLLDELLKQRIAKKGA